MVSIIILSYNTRDLLRVCLDSVFSQTKQLKKEVIVVDNHSTDKTVEMVKKEFPEVTIVENKENTGFAKGCNIGVKHAKGEDILFLNSDTQLTEDGLQGMLSKLDSDEKIGVIGGKLINQTHRTSASFGTFFSVPSIFLMIFGLDKFFIKHNPSIAKEVDWVSGGFMLLKKELFEKVNGFDERFFMYVEDVDLCFRIKKLGLKVLYVPEFEALHKGQGSSSRSFAVLYIFSGMLLFFKKHKSMAEYNMVKIILLSKASISFIIGVFKRDSYLINTYKQAFQTVFRR